MKASMKTKCSFPVSRRVIAQQQHGKNLYCLVCKQEIRQDRCPVRVSFDGSSVLLDETGENGWPSDSIAALCSFEYHRTINATDDVATNLIIADEIKGGDLSFHFCSTACLRSFFTQAIDEFEKKIHKAEKRKTKDKRKLALES